MSETLHVNTDAGGPNPWEALAVEQAGAPTPEQREARMTDIATMSGALAVGGEVQMEEQAEHPRRDPDVWSADIAVPSQNKVIEREPEPEGLTAAMRAQIDAMSDQQVMAAVEGSDEGLGWWMKTLPEPQLQYLEARNRALGRERMPALIRSMQL